MKSSGGRDHARVLAAIMIVLILALAASAPTYSSGQARPAASAVACSKATGRKLIDASQLNGFLLPPAQVLCGPFTGPGSVAMAVTIAASTCWAVQRWAVFAFRAGSWKLVFQRGGFIYPPLVAAGSDIRVETALFLPSDTTRCNPNGGSQSRRWHWNGRTFIPGAPTRVKPATPPKLLEAHFSAPGRQIGCDVYDNPPSQQGRSDVFCSSSVGFRTSALLDDDSKVTVCKGAKQGDCIGTPGYGSKVLGYGKQISVGRFNCKVSQAGVECIVTATGKGFLINATSAKAVP
jgi:hypothetical protein